MVKTPNHKIAKAIGIAVISFLVPYFAGAITTTEGVGTHFEITDSQYLNIILDSSEQIKLRMESVPETVTMMVESPTFLTATSTQITLSGFATSTTYYKYEDNYHNLTQFTTDENGHYSYIQDISTSHIVFIQPHKSTKFIRNDVTGGDCASIGIWNLTTLTCMLTVDITGTIQIDSDGITLDGNGHTITGSGTGNGVYLSGKTGVTIKNLNVTKFSSGIFSYFSNNNTLTNNITSNNNDRGIYLYSSSNNTLTNNIAQENGYSDVYVYASLDSHCNNNITNTIGSGGRPIKYFTGVVNLNSEILSELILCNADGSNISNITIDGSIIKNNNGLVLMRTDSSTIADVNSSNNAYGIDLYFSSNNTLTNNTITNNYNGIFLYSSNNNILTSNTSSNNPSIGIYPYSSNNNQIYNNNLINNFTQARVSGGNGNVFNLASPIGGNYWSNFDTLAKGCNDANSDNFCDSPYVFYGGQDNLPWTTLDGWKSPTNQPPTISNLLQFKSDGVTPIAETSITTESTVGFKATLSDTDNDQIKLQLELKAITQLFDGINLLESNLASSGSELAITKNLISEGAYHWRARAMDDKGNASEWQELGITGNTDFEVKIPLSYKAANLAKELVNQPYLWGGKGWDYSQNLFATVSAIKTGYRYYNPDIKSVDTGIGVDCSGLVMWSYDRSFDSTKSRLNNFVKVEGADGQYRYNTITTTESALQKGDVMFFDWNSDGYMDHEAMYVGESGGYDVVSATDFDKGIEVRSKNLMKNLTGFRGFKQVISALPPAVLATAHSPVDLILTDPDGFTITATTTIPSDTEYLREIPGVLYYSEMEKGVDGNPLDQVYSYVAKTGDYIIKVVPAVGALPTKTYTLDFKAGGQTIILAQDVPLSQIPSGGYGVTTSATGTMNPFIPVVIDIMPGSYPNNINLKSDGTVPVAIFSSATFDVTKIDPVTIKLANAPVKLKDNGQQKVKYKDINKDGFADMVVKVVTNKLQITSADTKAILDGTLFDGRKIRGLDSVHVIATHGDEDDQESKVQDGGDNEIED